MTSVRVFSKSKPFYTTLCLHNLMYILQNHTIILLEELTRNFLHTGAQFIIATQSHGIFLKRKCKHLTILMNGNVREIPQQLTTHDCNTRQNVDRYLTNHLNRKIHSHERTGFSAINRCNYVVRFSVPACFCRDFACGFFPILRSHCTVLSPQACYLYCRKLCSKFCQLQVGCWWFVN